MNIRKLAGITILLALCTLANADLIDTVTITRDGYGAGDTAKIWGGGYSEINTFAGVLGFEKISGTGDGQLLDNGWIGGFCMDIPQSLFSSTATYQLVNVADGPNPTGFLGGPMGQQKADYLAELWGRHFDEQWVSGSSWTYLQKQSAEAFQIAIWEIIYEGMPATPDGWNVKSDGTYGQLGFKASEADRDLANQWLSSLDGTGPMANLMALTNAHYQDILIAIPHSVPEPATLIILALGGMLLRIKK